MTLSDAATVQSLASLLEQCKTAVLTGAGCSTESGIPDYRGVDRPAPRRPPIQYREFVHDEHARRRYWARSMIGWRAFSRALPNAGHYALAALERVERVRGVITQNVDRLHHAAGARRVIELHGALAEVRCLDCGAAVQRAELQIQLEARNPELAKVAARSAPDGDAELAVELVESFVPPACSACQGMLKPNVVFFGENVPRVRVDAAFELLHEAELLLVVGSSLTVFSGFRFAREASRRGMPIAIVNRGPTRADPLAAYKLEMSAGSCLTEIARRLGALT
ncbi:MAG TPA: NAD-dependent protein deacetylase [Polyangiaceae bacterium]|nr:NAD-dependent protein deacetylase [Polyangiaceae bacterium]